MQLYQLLFPNGKSYIGITSKTAQERFKRHCNPAEKQHLCQKAIKKYGKENVKIIVLAELDNWELLCLAEREAIEKFNSFQPQGYNLTMGGDGAFGSIVKKETKEKMSLSAKARTDGNIEKLKKSRLGKTNSDESKLKSSISAKKRVEKKRKEQEEKKQKDIAYKAYIRTKRLMREIAQSFL